MVVPSLPPGPGGPASARPDMEPLSKDSLRRAALDARKAFVRTLSDADRARLEHKLAERPSAEGRDEELRAKVREAVAELDQLIREAAV